MEPATLRTNAPRTAVRLERNFAKPREAVWRALTDRAELNTWFPCDIATEEWKVGAALAFTFRNGEGPALTGAVLELDAPRLLVFTWGDDTLRFELTPTPAGGTLLVLIDELPPGSAARNAAGWEDCLELLAGHEPPPETWKARFDRYAAEFEPVVGPQEGPPPGFDEGA
jgi:uncharacterized protein YndB with AHSA1/START domain